MRVFSGMIGRFILPLAMLIGSGLAQAPDVVIRSNAREVLLDVVVHDAHGKLVTNLKPEDVTVFEDGVSQDVRSFRLVSGAEVRAEDEREAAEAKAAPAKTTAPAARPPINPLRTVNVVCLILNNLTAATPGDSLRAPTRTFAFEAARKFIDNQLRPNTYIGIFALDSSGLRPIYPFSNDRERLLKAAQLAAMNQLPSIAVGTGAMLNGLSSSIGITTMGDRGSAVPYDPLGTQHDMTASTIEGLRELDALKGLIAQLGPLPFHKTALLLSNGLARPPDQLEYWDSLVRSAIAGGVTFYAVDVNALDPFYDPTATSSAMLSYAASLSTQQGPTSRQGYTQSGDAAVTLNGLAVHTMEQSHQDDYVRFAVSSANQQETLRELAERTGGFLIANTNNVEPLLAHVMEEVDTHYEISYPPRSERDDGHFRKIEVKLKRPGLRVETRSGYFAVPDKPGHPLTAAEMAGLRALDTQPRPHTFDYLSRAYRFRDTGGRAQYSIAFEMPIHNLTATPEKETHMHRMHASLLALVKNADGVIVDRVSKDVPSEVSDDHATQVQAELMTYQHAVSLAPGHYTVETAVVDDEGQRASTGVLAIDSRPESGIEMSDLTLVRKLEDLSVPADPEDPFEYNGKRVLPFVTTDLFAGAQPFVYFMIYPIAGNAAKPILRVRLLQNGRQVATIRPEAPPADAAGAIPMLVQLTARPGKYEVRATVSQGNRSVERSMTYTLEGK